MGAIALDQDCLKAWKTPQKRQHYVAQFASLAQRAPSPGHALAGTDVIQRSGVLWPHDGFQRCVRYLNPGINPGKEAVSTIPCALLPLPPSCADARAA